ncbi:uncharacterized protein GGS22DRAFT_7345 [Annulohypoxylon maeteangense]|uniref:uncharacterized protein n=1 Tax=Annulohypoxylon maeteangense TaxID=1927788 RepID=UPI0020089A19|nr:uncharacterized protein GGS22DRAFT_7345 [Annulohypoxylon maeteangense]KAI0890030.1 hypothetical protein GGS22DRAFT_7345 [Annulohypoxylon maeteangense]
MTKSKSKSHRKVVSQWDEYFGTGDLQAWQQLMDDLGIPGTFRSKTQCRKALRNVWVNIVDFLHDVREGRQPHLFESQAELGRYTRKHKKFYPKREIPKDSPLKSLLAMVRSY